MLNSITEKFEEYIDYIYAVNDIMMSIIDAIRNIDFSKLKSLKGVLPK